MLKSYFTTALRNFWRNKTFSFINIVGLAIGISASLIIFLLVQYDFSFDKFEKDSSRIYRVVTDGTNTGGSWQYNCLPEPMGEAAKKGVAGLENVTLFRTLGEIRVTVPYPNASTPQVFRKQKDVIYADDNYFNLIGYTWLAGSPATATRQPYQVVLTEKNARLYYAGLGNDKIIGKSIIFDDTILCTVTGIVKDLPGNTDFYFNTIVSRPTLYTARLKPEYFGHWGSINSADQLFVRLAPGIQPAAVDSRSTRILRANETPRSAGPGQTICKAPAFQRYPLQPGLRRLRRQPPAPINPRSTACWRWRPSCCCWPVSTLSI
ncbi:ABC transporter permease [Puia sp. P3]|uniref:ABC transporter permease n=1 Tax=Puia sp. P3 TaxID=3423952 RepID=UPI003D66E486